jgi:hypothetical protein
MDTPPLTTPDTTTPLTMPDTTTPDALETLVARFNARRWRFWVTLVLLGNHPIEAYKLARKMP